MKLFPGANYQLKITKVSQFFLRFPETLFPFLHACMHTAALNSCLIIHVPSTKFQLVNPCFWIETYSIQRVSKSQFFYLLNAGLSHVCASTTCQGSSHTDTNETNRQPEAVGCSLSNTSCDGEILDEIEGSVKSKTQVSAASLVVARNPSDSKSSMFEVSFLRESPSTSAMVAH